MTSIFERAPGEDFNRLHPMMQKRFGVGLHGGYACVGHGMMQEVRRGPWWTVPFVHEFQVRKGKPSRFDATMIWSEDRNRVIDYLGTHQHLAVDLDLAVEPDGSLLLTTHSQRFYEGRWIAFNFPMLFTGRAVLREWFDDDDVQVFRIDLEVRNPVFGFLFGYSGSFTCEFPAADDAPTRLEPVRHEVRD